MSKLLFEQKHFSLPQSKIFQQDWLGRHEIISFVSPSSSFFEIYLFYNIKLKVYLITYLTFSELIKKLEKEKLSTTA